MNFEIERINTDVAIIGGGLAGCMAAIKAADYDVSVLLIEKSNTKRSGMAGTGIGHLWSYIPPVHEEMGYTVDDLIEDHAEIVGQGGFMRRDLLRLMAETMYDRVMDLEEFGLKFRFPDSEAPGGFRLIYQFHCVPTSFDFEGRDIKRILTQQVKQKGVDILNRIMGLDFILDQDNHVCGVVGASTVENKIYQIFAKSVILSTSGGIGRLNRSFVNNNFNRHLPPSGSTGDGKVMAFRAGAELINMEFFGGRRPTFRNYPMSAGAPRNTFQPCARLVTADGEVIVPRTYDYDWDNINQNFSQKDDSDKLKERHLKRDGFFQNAIATKVAQMIRNGQGPVYFDCAEGTEEELAHVKSAMSNQGKMWIFKKFLDDNGVDLRKDKIEFGLGDAGMIGSASGIWVDADCQSNIQGLYIAGQEIGGVPWAAGTGAITTGWHAGKAAGERAAKMKQQKADDAKVTEKVLARVEQLMNRKKGEHWSEVEYALQDVVDATYIDGLTSDLLLVRGLSQVEDLVNSSQMLASNPHELMRCLEVQNLLDCARIIMKAGLERKESRAMFRKIDHPRTAQDWFVFLAAQKSGDNGEIHFTKKAISTKNKTDAS